MPSFNGVDLIITLDAGVTAVDVQDDLYSPWKNFVLSSDGAGNPNSRFPPAFRTIAGDPLPNSVTAAPYFFLRNDFGWRIRPPEEDITINLTDNLVPQDALLPVVVPTLGGFTALILGIQPVTQSVQIMALDVALIRQMVAGNATISLDDQTITVFEADGITVLAVLSISPDGRVRTRIS